ncbi:unnamed protein product [Durusdinium trenchii]|uniref:Uncharacterized protein n=1 Tax=Durusdinium trenchii TaxID=1381693 RepID=A0ABP0P1M1_9DINO
MLTDSKDLTMHVLRKLGYFDDLNADEHEALFCFTNAMGNKHTLRKMDLLPHPADRSQDVREKLRAAFLSHAFSGQWQVVHMDDNAIMFVQQILWKEGLLTESQLTCTQYELIRPMKAYAKKYGLRLMESFNALAFQIQHHSNQNPDKRPMIDFER